jgi:hypothetical protein
MVLNNPILNYQTLENSVTEEQSPLSSHTPNLRDRQAYRSIERPKSSFDNYLQAPFKNDSLNLIKPSNFKLDRPHSHSRNQSTELSRNKFNYVYKRIELE